jgi:hypothetical protein
MAIVPATRVLDATTAAAVASAGGVISTIAGIKAAPASGNRSMRMSVSVSSATPLKLRGRADAHHRDDS